MSGNHGINRHGQIAGNSFNSMPFHHVSRKSNGAQSLPVNAVQGGQQFFKRIGQKKQILVCVFCGMTRHTVERCYKKHGYPPRFPFKNESQALGNQASFSVGDNQEAYEFVSHNNVGISRDNDYNDNINTNAAHVLSHDE